MNRVRESEPMVVVAFVLGAASALVTGMAGILLVAICLGWTA